MCQQSYFVVGSTVILMMYRKKDIHFCRKVGRKLKCTSCCHTYWWMVQLCAYPGTVVNFGDDSMGTVQQKKHC